MRFAGWRATGLGLALLAASGCAPRQDFSRIPLSAWRPATDLQAGLPQAVRVFALDDPEFELRAWFVEIDTLDPSVELRVLACEDADHLETVSRCATRVGACVVTNGGFFGVRDGDGNPLGLVVSEGRQIRPAWKEVVREDGRRYPVTRATLGFDRDGRGDIAWVSRLMDEQHVEWSAPWPNVPGTPTTARDPSGAVAWSAHDAVQGGPNLLRDGEVRITADAEVVRDRIRDRHPRTAAGLKADGTLVLMVVDGRQWNSRGVDLLELAGMLREVGCVDAINLDGGGSSALAIDGQLVNRPEGNRTEREVSTFLAVFCRSTGDPRAGD